MSIKKKEICKNNPYIPHISVSLLCLVAIVMCPNLTFSSNVDFTVATTVSQDQLRVHLCDS